MRVVEVHPVLVNNQLTHALEWDSYCTFLQDSFPGFLLPPPSLSPPFPERKNELPVFVLQVTNKGGGGL